MKDNKFYCYIDESGQDTNGKFFIVVLFLKENAFIQSLETNLEHIENITGKKNHKWKKTSLDIRKLYLHELSKVEQLSKSIYFSHYRDQKHYTTMLSEAIVRTINHLKIKNYSVNIIVDGLNNKDREILRNYLKKSKILYHKIRGMDDEQSVFLRLVDSFAGFLRDYFEKDKYTESIMKKLNKRQIITRV